MDGTTNFIILFDIAPTTNDIKLCPSQSFPFYNRYKTTRRYCSHVYTPLVFNKALCNNKIVIKNIVLFKPNDRQAVHSDVKMRREK